MPIKTREVDQDYCIRLLLLEVHGCHVGYAEELSQLGQHFDEANYGQVCQRIDDVAARLMHSIATEARKLC